MNRFGDRGFIVSSKSVRWHVSPLPGPLLDTLLTYNPGQKVLTDALILSIFRNIISHTHRITSRRSQNDFFSHPFPPGSMLVLQSRGQLTNFDRYWALTNIEWGGEGMWQQFGPGLSELFSQNNSHSAETIEGKHISVTFPWAYVKSFLWKAVFGSTGAWISDFFERACSQALRRWEAVMESVRVTTLIAKKILQSKKSRS